MMFHGEMKRMMKLPTIQNTVLKFMIYYVSLKL